MRWPALVALVSLAGVTAVLQVREVGATLHRGNASSAVPSGKPAPKLEVFDRAGAARTLDSWRGKIVIVSFWQSWCGPCRLEMPQVAETVDGWNAEHKDPPIVFLAVNPGEDPRGLGETLDDPRFKNVAFAFDPARKAMEAWQVEGFPTLFVIDPQGVVASSEVGYDSNARWKLRAALESIREKQKEGAAK